MPPKRPAGAPCKHKCKDKSTCAHACCKVGLAEGKVQPENKEVRESAAQSKGPKSSGPQPGSVAKTNDTTKKSATQAPKPSAEKKREVTCENFRPIFEDWTFSGSGNEDVATSKTADLLCGKCKLPWDRPVELIPCHHIVCASCAPKLQAKQDGETNVATSTTTTAGGEGVKTDTKTSENKKDQEVTARASDGTGSSPPQLAVCPVSGCKLSVRARTLEGVHRILVEAAKEMKVACAQPGCKWRGTRSEAVKHQKCSIESQDVVIVATKRSKRSRSANAEAAEAALTIKTETCEVKKKASEPTKKVSRHQSTTGGSKVCEDKDKGSVVVPPATLTGHVQRKLTRREKRERKESQYSDLGLLALISVLITPESAGSLCRVCNVKVIKGSEATHFQGRNHLEKAGSFCFICNTDVGKGNMQEHQAGHKHQSLVRKCLSIEEGDDSTGTGGPAAQTSADTDGTNPYASL